MNSKAWHRLTPVERCTWLEIVAFYNGSNNGCIASPNRLIGDRLNVAHTTIGRAISTLITLGFLERTKRSDFSRKNREASEYRLTHLKCDVTGQLPSKAFMRLGSADPGDALTSTNDAAEPIGRPH